MSQAGSVLSSSGTIDSLIIDADVGTASPSGSILNVIGGAGIITSAAGNTVIITSTVSDKTLTGNTGGAISSVANNWDLLGTGSITIAGSPGTLTTQLTGLTNHSVQVGAGTATLTQLAVGTNGQVLIGSTGADPKFSTLTSSGGTITFTPGPGTLNLESGINAGTITGDTGGALSQTAGNWNIISTATNGIQTTGSGSTLTVAMASPYGDASFAFTRAAAGATNTLTIENTSNTASSNALQQVSVGGTSAGDAFTTYAVTGTTNWSQGIDNSDSGDSFVLSSSTTLGTSNVLSVLTTGSITHTSTSNTLPLFISNRQLDTNAASTSFIQAVTVAGSAADSYFLMGEEATRMYCIGVDDSDSAKLKINTGAADPTPSTETNLFSMTVNGSDVVFSTVNNGVTKNLTFANTDNNANSACNVGISVGGTSAGDAKTTYTVTGTTNWSVGVDNSVTSPTADPFVIAASTTLGTSNALSIETTGRTSFLSGQVVAITTPGAYPYTTLATDYVILVDTASARTITPMASPITGQTYRIKDNVGSAASNNITITPSGKNIDGAASTVINIAYGSIDIVYNGTQWNIL